MYGLLAGIFSVGVAQCVVLGYHAMMKKHPKTSYIQQEREYEWLEMAKQHLFQPEGLALLLCYLSVSWHFQWLPESYYELNTPICWIDVAKQLLVQDALQYGCHVMEHSIPILYKKNHKHHHIFKNPVLFDAFQGSILDTVTMVIVPLYITSQVVHTNHRSYVVFGTVYSGWLTLIHSEFEHWWDRYLEKIGVGTASDHHVHHKLFKYNYGHVFMYWDWLFGTYRHPSTVFRQ
jgi:sterol desaturase/sphingolipid hydroxylase (fatty acid hydroxylase superfamily)